MFNVKCGTKRLEQELKGYVKSLALKLLRFLGHPVFNVMAKDALNVGAGKKPKEPAIYHEVLSPTRSIILTFYIK